MVENSELRKAGLKVTLPRVKILQMLDSTEQRHMSAEDVYKALMEAGEDVGLATVYRVLTQFEAAGLVVRHNFDGGHAVFELADGGHHDHMVNVESGEVIEFFDEEIEKLASEGDCRKARFRVGGSQSCAVRAQEEVSPSRGVYRRETIEGDPRVAFVFCAYIKEALKVQALAVTTIFLAWARDSLVRSMPPSIRATSSTLSFLPSLDTAV